MKNRTKNPITPKVSNKLFPVVFKAAVLKELRSYEGKLFEEMGPCPRCGCRQSILNHIEGRKTFAILIDENNDFEKIRVKIRYFRCKRCGAVHRAANIPFVKGINYAKPIIELVLYYSELPFHAIERQLLDLGVQVDRDTIRRWYIKFGREVHRGSARRFKEDEETRYADILGLLFGEERGEELAKEIQVAADETYPGRKGEQKKYRRQQQEEGGEGAKYPPALTVAAAYSCNLRLFASLLVSLAPFNRIMAEELLGKLREALSVLTDGHQAYAGLAARPLRCVVHKFRNHWKSYSRKKKYPPWFFSEEFKRFLQKHLEEVRERYPQLFDKAGRFLGALSTNALEGGNWRIKYMLKTLYREVEAIFGRTCALLIKESMYTLRGGIPEESYAHRYSKFQFTEVFLGR